MLHPSPRCTPCHATSPSPRCTPCPAAHPLARRASSLTLTRPASSCPRSCTTRTSRAPSTGSPWLPRRARAAGCTRWASSRWTRPTCSLYLPTSPYISLCLPISPYTSPGGLRLDGTDPPARPVQAGHRRVRQRGRDGIGEPRRPPGTRPPPTCNLTRHSAHPSSSQRAPSPYPPQVPTGVGGVGTNKGGVAVSFRVCASHVCFVNAHLAAHEGELHVRQRNANAADISQHLSVGKVRASLAQP